MHSESEGSVSSDSSSIPDKAIKKKLCEGIENPNHVEFHNIREKYGDVLDRLNQMKDLSGAKEITTEELKKHLEESDVIFDNVKRTIEARLDARVLKQAGYLGKVNIEETQSSLLTFRPSEYADCLTKFLDNRESLPEMFDSNSLSLKRMSEAMRYLYRSTYGLESLYSALDWEPPEKAPRESQRVQKELKPNMVRKYIEEVKDSATYEENQSEEVTRIFNVLKKRFHENECQPIPLLEFAIDPTCFCTTIQNIFHVSFLVRDRNADILFDEYKIPLITPVSRRDKEIRTVSSSNESSVQSVIEMNLSLWNEAIELLEIKKPMIPKVAEMPAKRRHP